MEVPLQQSSSGGKAPTLAAFLDEVGHHFQLGVRERLAVETLLREWQADQRGGELRGAIVSLLAQDHKSWQEIANLWDLHFPIDSDTQSGEEGDAPPRGLLRLSQRTERAKPSRSPRTHVRRAVALGLVGGLIFVYGAGLRIWWLERNLSPESPIVSIPRPLPLPDLVASYRPVPIEGAVSTEILEPPPPSPGMLALLAVASTFLLALGIHLHRLPAIVGGSRQQALEHRRKEGHAKRVDWEERRRDAGLPLEISYRVDRFPAVSKKAILDSAQPLGRIFREERSDDLDVDRTLDRTVRRAGMFSPVLLSRQLREEVLVLIDREEGDYPWLGPFRRLVAAWAALGVTLRVYEMEGGYSFEEVDPRNPEGEDFGSDLLTLDPLTRRTRGLPLIFFSRHLDPVARKKASPWLQALPNWPRRAWLDPDPLPWKELRPAHRAVIEGWEREGLRRFPLTGDGIVRLAWYLAGRPPGRATEVSLLPLAEERPAAGSGNSTEEALRLWGLAAALVPDPTWDQLEAIRRHFPEIRETLSENRYVQRLLQWMAREMGAPRRDLSQDRRLEISREVEDTLIREQRALDEALPWEERFETRARRLLLQQLAPTRPEDRLDAGWWEFKQTMHLAVLRDEAAQRRLKGYLQGPWAPEAAPKVLAELDRQEGGSTTEVWPQEIREELRAEVDPALARQRPLRFGDFRWGRFRDYVFLLTASAMGGVFLFGLTGLLSPILGAHYSVTRNTSVEQTLWRLEEEERQFLKGGIEWITIDGGEFQMGSETGGRDEVPVHSVTVPTFLLSRTEVTVAQYKLCQAKNGCEEYEKPPLGFLTKECNWDQEGREDHPMNCISWSKARTFAAWAGGRLPTEAEWEFAARSRGKPREYPWGDEPADCDRAVIPSTEGAGCGEGHTLPVCSRSRGNSEQGLCDMAGNVWEWVEDDWQGNYEGAPADGSVPRHSGHPSRVIRGGSWWYYPRSARAAFRYRRSPSSRSDDLGFRVARSKPLALDPLDPRQEEGSSEEAP